MEKIIKINDKNFCVEHMKEMDKVYNGIHVDFFSCSICDIRTFELKNLNW